MADQAIKHAIKLAKDMADTMAATGATREQINQALEDALPTLNQIISAERVVAKTQRLRRTLLQAFEQPVDGKGISHGGS
ncbi:hypothetical protein FA743_10955 [Paracoccus gahaiensis]|uniref:Uncharacterized protein n=1 Tax=Paracoccus gahaiensis TaxID=1706839 RepID=A0A4U0R9E8_9RHOB|nr:hypothetical protein [Paracoccus gahaiensis]TJZ91607.1 hypothetical protein FA743_10955 [Paracoccus gahaiensis]